MPTLESLATSLLASLEASWVVPWILSVVGKSVMELMEEGREASRTGDVVSGALDGIHGGGWWLFGVGWVGD